jgi:hypothetical protein
MAYPLKVQLAQKVQAVPPEAPQQASEGKEGAPALAPAKGGKELEKDLSALAAVEEEKERPGAEARDARQELDKQQVRLNQLLRAGKYCQGAQELERVALQILSQAAYDKAAYHAMVLAGIVQQDLKLIYLMSKIGQRALFLSNIYTYDLPQSVQAKLDFWQNVVFNPASRRTGREIVLEFVECTGQPQVRAMPAELLAIDIPRESLRMLASRRARVNFAEFKGLDAATFLQRVYHLIDVSARASRGKEGDDPVAIAFTDLPPAKLGVLQLDLTDLDLFGYPGQVPFQLRRERGQWLSYVSDGDRRKRLLLPEGNYYLMVDKKVRNVYTIRADKTAPLASR